MSKKDYKKFATIIKNRVNIQRTSWNAELFMIASDMAKAFQEDNPRFDRSKFLIACGVLDGNK